MTAPVSVSCSKQNKSLTQTGLRSISGIGTDRRACVQRTITVYLVGQKRASAKLGVGVPPQYMIGLSKLSREAEPTAPGPLKLFVGLFRSHGSSRCDTNDFLPRSRNLPARFPRMRSNLRISARNINPSNRAIKRSRSLRSV